jgi:putative heme-binding domain-containing protein
LKPKESTFEGERAPDEAESEFLASTDNWFRPVHVTTGPDGALWIADMYRFLIEHPKWIPKEDLAKIDARAGAGLGRIYRIRPGNDPVRKGLRLDGLDTAGLVAALDSPNGWQRDMAMMMLIWKGDTTAKEPLEQLIRESKNGLARMQALCTLDSLGGARRGLLERSLVDREPGVRQHAIRLGESLIGGSRTDPSILVKAPKLIDDPDPGVRLQLAFSLGTNSNNPREWKGLDFSSMTMAQLFWRHRDDPFLTAAILSSLAKENLPGFAEASLRGGGKDGPPKHLMREILATAAGLEDAAALSQLLHLVTKSEGGAYKPWQLASAAGVLDSFSRKGRSWEKIPADIRLPIAPLLTFARQTSETDEATEDALLASIPLLGRDPRAIDADLARLATLLRASRPAAVQLAAIAALARSGNENAAATLIVAWPGATPALRQQMLDALLGRPNWQGRLLTAIENGTIAPGQIDAARRQRLLNSTDKSVSAKAAKLFEGGSNADRQKVVESYTSALSMTGDRSRGKAVFAKTCSACHQLEGVGHAVGPDLAALANKSPLYLLSEVFDPNRNLDSRYSEYQIVTKDERTISGILAAETATVITLRGQQGKDETILRSDIQSLRGTSKSLMPEGLEKDLSKQEVSDLIAYLTANDPPHKRLAGNEPAEIEAKDNSLTLPATRCFVFGGAITFEADFKNIGYWSDEKDYVVWKVRLENAAQFDLYLDYACDAHAAGNRFAIDGLEPAIRGKIDGTGGWDHYRLLKVGTVKLPAGAGRIAVRPDAPIHGALCDLRAVYLVPVGTQPKVETSYQPDSQAEIARLLLDDQLPRAQRERMVELAIPRGGEVIRLMTADVSSSDSKEEYRRIPWIWRVAIGAGRANDAKVLAAVLEVSIPKKTEPLRDWQAVVIGGGIINGLSLEGKWPAERLTELLRDNAELQRRWLDALQAAHIMTDAEKVPMGTRYDALRIIALDEWKRAEPRLSKYLAKSTNPELQQGAVSGLVDVDESAATRLLVNALTDLTTVNRRIAIKGLLRTPARVNALLDALENGTAKAEWIGKDHRETLLQYGDVSIRARAKKILAK